MLRLQELMRQPQGRRGRTKSQEDAIRRVRHRLAPDLRRHFDSLLNHARKPVAALSETGSCGNCHLKLTPAQVLHIHWAKEQIHSCPHCGCFLYAQSEAPEAEKRMAA